MVAREAMPHSLVMLKRAHLFGLVTFTLLAAVASGASASDETATPTRTLKNLTITASHHPTSISTTPFGRLISDFVVDAKTALPAGMKHFTFASNVTTVSFGPGKSQSDAFVNWRYFDGSACAKGDDACRLKAAQTQCPRFKYTERTLWKKAGTNAFVEVSAREYRGLWTSGVGSHCGPAAAKSYAHDYSAKYAPQGYGQVPTGADVDVYRTVVEAGLAAPGSVLLTDPPATHWMVKTVMHAAP
jgi:hypothetical protein